MTTNWIDDIRTYFKNLTLGSSGDRKTIYELMEKNAVGKVLSMMTDKEDDIDQALKEYNPQLHDVMKRRNKHRDDGEPYITEKLPRTRERYINEVELFFLLGEPIKWMKKEGEDEAFKLFTEYLDSTFFNAKIRQCKRLAGAETVSALVTHYYRNEGDTIGTDVFVVARSTGYKIKYLFDQYKNLIAFAYGYCLKENGKNVRYWNIETADVIYECRKGGIGWQVEEKKNPSGKINAILFVQPKAWDGSEQRIRRDEMLDSKIGDTNNYYADPIAAATADVINSLPDVDKPGRLIQMPSEKSQFRYIDPPRDAASRRDEKDNLNRTILFDTLTPDFSFENMKGMGTLTGKAIHNAMIIGYIKRANRMEIYEEMIQRFVNLTLKVLTLIHPEKKTIIDSLKVGFEFSDPFPEDSTQMWSGIGGLYRAGLVSLETAVTMLALTDAPSEEIERIRLAAFEQQEVREIIGKAKEEQASEETGEE